MTPIETILAVAQIGGRLGINTSGDKIRMLLPADCPPELKDEIRTNKDALLRTIKSDFLIVQSDALRSMIFWVPDDATKDVLINAGADPGTVYTAPELEALTTRRISVSDLQLIHEAKVKFQGRVS